MRQDGYFVKGSVAKQLQTGSVCIIELTVAESLNLIGVAIERLHDPTGSAPTEPRLLTGVEVISGHEDLVSFGKVRQLATGRRFTGLISVLE